jgi:hypothetical protein
LTGELRSSAALCGGGQLLVTRVLLFPSDRNRTGPPPHEHVVGDERSDCEHRSCELDGARPVTARDLDREGRNGDQIPEERRRLRTDPLDGRVPRED